MTVINLHKFDESQLRPEVAVIIGEMLTVIESLDESLDEVEATGKGGEELVEDVILFLYGHMKPLHQFMGKFYAYVKHDPKLTLSIDFRQRVAEELERFHDGSSKMGNSTSALLAYLNVIKLQREFFKAVDSETPDSNT